MWVLGSELGSSARSVCVCVSSRVSVSFTLAFLLQDVLVGT